MYKNIIKIDKKSDINKNWPNFNNKIKSYKLVLKDKEYNLIFKYCKLIKIDKFNLSEKNKEDCLVINKYGGWNLALKGIIREIWLRDIENKTEEEIINDKNKIFEKVINNNLKNEYINEYYNKKINPILEKCTNFHGTPEKVICNLCLEDYRTKAQLAYQEACQKWKEKNNN